MPFVFVDGVRLYGALNGTLHLTFEQGDLTVTDEGRVMPCKRDVLALRMTPHCGAKLRAALDTMLLALTSHGAKDRAN